MDFLNLLRNTMSVFASRRMTALLGFLIAVLDMQYDTNMFTELGVLLHDSVDPFNDDMSICRNKESHAQSILAPN